MKFWTSAKQTLAELKRSALPSCCTQSGCCSHRPFQLLSQGWPKWVRREGLTVFRDSSPNPCVAWPLEWQSQPWWDLGRETSINFILCQLPGGSWGKTLSRSQQAQVHFMCVSAHVRYPQSTEKVKVTWGTVKNSQSRLSVLIYVLHLGSLWVPAMRLEWSPQAELILQDVCLDCLTALLFGSPSEEQLRGSICETHPFLLRHIMLWLSETRNCAWWCSLLIDRSQKHL